MNKNSTRRIPRRFDSNLLEQSKRQRLAAFKLARVDHPKLIACVEAVLQQLQAGSKRNIVGILGPTGVGKTELLLSLCRRINAMYADEMKRDPGFIPCTYVEVPAATGATFDFNDLMYRRLRALKDPFVGQWDPALLKESEGSSPTSDKLWMDLRISTGLRLAHENAVRERRPLACLYDEVHHLCKVGPRRTMKDQAETMKSLANLTNELYVCAGTERATQLFRGDAQILARSKIVAFLPYSISKADRTAHFNFAQNLLARMPVERLNEDVFDAEYLFLGSAGEAGILKTWFQEAFERCLDEKSHQCFSRKHLVAAQWSSQDLLALVEAAEETTSALSVDYNLDLVRSRMKLRRPRQRNRAAVPSRVAGAAKTGKCRPGRRAPSMDPIGGAIDETASKP
jgi:hypothetical protein